MARFNAKSEGLNVEGLADLRRDLKAISADAPKELVEASKEIASFVADDARDKAAGLGGVAARVADTVKGSGTARGGAITLGGAAHPEALGAEFGGRGRPTTQQFQPHKGRTGYFVYPAIRDNADEIESAYVEKLDDLFRRHDL